MKYDFFLNAGQGTNTEKKHPLENPEEYSGRIKKQKTGNESTLNEVKSELTNNPASTSHSNGNTKEIENKRRDEYLDNMEKIEKEFTDLKEKFFAERMAEIRKELELLKSGTCTLIKLQIVAHWRV
jgi:hypothetical protein